MLPFRKPLAWIVAGLLAFGLIAGCGGGGSEGSSAGSENGAEIAAAKDAYAKAAKGGEDLAAGPCIAEHLHGAPDWVADIAHDPRQDVDDEPANQCRSYRDGETHHFVELTPDGTLIRTG